MKSPEALNFRQKSQSFRANHHFGTTLVARMNSLLNRVLVCVLMLLETTKI